MSAITNAEHASATRTSQSIACPDPSAHAQSHSQRTLQDHAAGAALYATQGKKERSNFPLGADNKLSSAGMGHAQITKPTLTIL
jgi:hypothetical protein